MRRSGIATKADSIMTDDPRAIHIYTDGSCFKNPGGESGCAAIVVYPDEMNRDEEQIFEFGCAESNNNRMELLAGIAALQWVRSNKPWPQITRVQIFTDSKYVFENISRARFWKANDWRNRHGEPKENSDLWKQLLSAHSKVGMTVHFEWNLGKKTPVLKRVDKAAKLAAKGGGDVDRGYKPGTVSRSMVKGAAIKFPASGQIASIRPYRKNVMHKGENKIRFDTFDVQGYSKSCYAFASPVVAAELHRQHGYRVQFNDNPEYPQILSVIEETELPKLVSSNLQP
jgi:ribonuclease HI